MKISNSVQRYNFKARMSKDLQDKLAKDRIFLFNNPRLAHEDEDLYVMNYSQISRIFPDGELCLDKDDKNSLILKHAGKKDIQLGKLPMICSMTDIAEKLYDAMDNISMHLK